MRIELKFK